MKLRHLTYIFLMVTFFACESDPHWQPKELMYSDSFIPSWNTAGVLLSIDAQSNAITQQVKVCYSINEDFADEQIVVMARNEKDQWSATISGLQDSSLYYVRYLFTPSYLQPKANGSSSFRTTPLPAPSVQTNAATDITATTAILHANVQSYVSGDAVSERGFYYSLLREGEYERKQIKCGSGIGNYNAQIEALRANATYYYVAYAINKHGIAYGDTLQFNTLNPYQ